MKMYNSRSRKAISPIIATVLIVAVTLVASVAIAGFVFGIFGTSTNSAQVAVTSASLIAAQFLSTGTTTTFTCGSATGSFLTLSNTGTAGTSVTSATITWAGGTNSFSASGGCTIGAQGQTTATQSLLFPTTSKLSTSATSGGTFTGTVTLANGAVLVFTGTFQ